MGIVIFAIFAILFLFGMPILITLIVSRIALAIKRKKDNAEKGVHEKK